MIRRSLLFAFSLLLAALLVACAPEEPAPEPAPEPDSNVEEPAAPELPNPMEEMDGLNFDGKLGWSINNWPEAYPYDHAYVVAGAVGEVDFEASGDAVSFRTAAEKEGDVSGVYDTFTETKSGTLGGATVEIRYTEGETGLAIWYKEGYVHTLYMKSGASYDKLFDMAEAIASSVSIGPWLEK